MAAPPAPGRQVLGISLIVTGTICALAVFGISVVGTFSSVTRFDTDDMKWVRLEPGSYTAYLETAGLFPMNPESAFESVDLLLWHGSGRMLPVYGARTWAGRYTTGRRAGVAIGSFTIDRDGKYVLAATHQGNATLIPPGEIVVARSAGPSALARTALIPLALLGAGVGIGIAILVRRPRPAGSAPTPPRP